MTKSSGNGARVTNSVREGELLWTPSAKRVAEANVTKFIGWLARERGLTFNNYAELWKWSVEDLDAFWGAIWDYFEIESSGPPACVLGKRAMPGAEWFPGARLNYAQHVMRAEKAGGNAVLFANETAALTGVPWKIFAARVRNLATRLRGLGLRPGDRIVAYMPNIPETMVAMLATTAIGAIWACCSPDFGSRGVIDRFQQLTPKLLFCVDGYRYGGRAFNRRAALAEINGALDGLEHVIHLPYLDARNNDGPRRGSLLWDDSVEGERAARENFEFEQVPFSHPLWVLFSS